MFKKYYKQANDDIKTNRELIDKIFEAAEKTVATNRKTKIYKFGMATAAVLVLGVSISMYSIFGGDNSSVKKSSSVANAENKNRVEFNSGEKIEHIETEIHEIPTNSTEDNNALANAGDNENTAENKSNDDKPIKRIDNEKKDNNEKSDKNQADSANKTENISPKTEKIEPVKEENRNETISSIEAETSVIHEQSDNGVVLAMEQGEPQSTSLSGGKSGRIAEYPESKNQNLNEFSLDDLSDVSDEEYLLLQNMLTACFGERDEETGNEYIFEIVGKTENVYLGRWRWFVEGHSSLLTEFVITADMSGMYECLLNEDDKVQWTTENNLLY